MHGLVDGRVEPARRADLLRRLAGSPADRAVVEAWQDQADLIREAFREVSTEMLPVALDLAPPRLRSVDVDRLHKSSAPKAPVRHGGGAAITAALLITIGLTLSWMAGSRDDSAAPIAARRRRDRRRQDGRAALVQDPGPVGVGPAAGPTWPPRPASPRPWCCVIAMAARAASPSRSRANAPDIGPMPLEHAGKSLTWRSQTAAFKLGGTVPAERLRAVAAALQADQGSD